MWVYIEKDNKAYNLDYVSRIVLEDAGPGGQIKAEYNGSFTMMAYFNQPTEAQRVFGEIMAAKGRTDSVYTLRGNK